MRQHFPAELSGDALRLNHKGSRFNNQYTNV